MPFVNPVVRHFLFHGYITSKKYFLAYSIFFPLGKKKKYIKKYESLPLLQLGEIAEIFSSDVKVLYFNKMSMSLHSE